MAQLNGHFYNLVADNTNSGVALDQLVAIIITQYAEIKVVLTTLKTTSSSTSYAAAAAADSTPSIPPDEAKRQKSSNWRPTFATTGIVVLSDTPMVGVSTKTAQTRTAAPRNPATFPLPHMLTLQAREEQ